MIDAMAQTIIEMKIIFPQIISLLSVLKRLLTITSQYLPYGSKRTGNKDGYLFYLETSSLRNLTRVQFESAGSRE